MLDILVLVCSIAVMLTGILGTLLPILPGTLLVFAGAFVYAWYHDFAVLTWPAVGLLGGLALLSQGIDWLATAIGARRFGASRWGVAGSCIGMLVGLLAGGLPGLLLGPCIGAVAGELLSGRSLRQSTRSGLGTVVGFLGGTIGRLAIALTMTAITCVYMLS